MSLDYVKSLTADNEVVKAIYERIEGRLLNRLKQPRVPGELEYIVEEATIKRFNRIGSEGMSSESVEGHSVTFEDNGDPLAPYEKAIAIYLGEDDDNKPRRGVIRAI